MSINTNLKDEIQQEKIPNGKKKTLLAAIELFSEKGFSATSTSQIAKHANVSEATIFKYFKTKDQLLNALLEPTIKALVPEYQTEFMETLENVKYDSIDKFATKIIYNRYEFIYENQQLAKILIEELLINDSLRKVISNLVKSHADQYDEALKKIIGQIKDFDKEITTFDLFKQTTRLLFGYVVQQIVINEELPKKPVADLNIIAKQLAIGLSS